MVKESGPDLEAYVVQVDGNSLKDLFHTEEVSRSQGLETR